jgi:hypothetical protein
MQVEGVDQAVIGDLPLVGEARLDLGAAMLELDQARIDGARRRVEIIAARRRARVEIGRRCFGAVDERLRVSGATQNRGGQQRGHETRGFFHCTPLV